VYGRGDLGGIQMTTKKTPEEENNQENDNRKIDDRYQVII